MPSKGVDYYSFIALDNTTIKFSGPKVGGTNTTNDNFVKHHLEIESGNLPWDEWTGTFQWDVIRGGQTLYSRKQEISSLTGNLGNGNLSPMMNTPAVVGADYVITYGLYDAGSGKFGLPNADQAWVTVIPNLSNWMGTVAPVNSAAADKLFSTYILAAAHDAGMNTQAGVKIVTTGAAAGIFYGILGTLILPAAAFLAANGPTILVDVAMTQKDTTTSMLNMGVRYFDFRPAYLVPGVRNLVSSGDDTLYHTHLVIPGQRFDSFLNEVVTFLKSHPTEIAVIRTCSDGIKLCEVPSHDTISQFVKNAVQGTGIAIGDGTSFQKKISDLRASNTRLILVLDNPKYDSYSDGPYATLNPATIVGAFNGMNTNGQSNGDFTVLQCQGTAEGISDVLAYSIAAANVSTSPLMSTKANFDDSTLTWIRSNALNNLKAQKNIMIMNDFIDGATTYTAYQLSQARFASQTNITGISSGIPAGVTGTLAAAIAAQAAAAAAVQAAVAAQVAAAAAAATHAAASVAPAMQASAQVAINLQAAQQAHTMAEKQLGDLQVKQAHLDAILAASKLAAKPVDATTLKAQEAAQQELAEAVSAQQQAVQMAQKAIAGATISHLI